MRDVSLSSAPEIAIERIGRDQTPVVTVDNLLRDPPGLVTDAINGGGFERDSASAYPGVKSPLPLDFYQAISPLCTTLLYRQYRIPATRKVDVVDSFFSQVTRRPEDLSVLQRVPHYDSNDRFFFALLFYMTEGPFGGTGFFRHRPTGFERISSARSGEYIASAEAYMARNGLPPARYTTGSDEHYEMIAAVAHRPNRLVIYPGNLLHSGLIDPERDISADASWGRLTANVFVTFR
ncbi:DUF6445 family protein [Marinimicrobium alkaliphilum]|uniref:DUF6445 family protein n=1 Tax=Marinimicrobium alkaliphilum TaxID=2202654 RepID=UPI0013005F14|nr:DUF6445 family protein [Marinimicrobium alkaliphilum]